MTRFFFTVGRTAKWERRMPAVTMLTLNITIIILITFIILIIIIIIIIFVVISIIIIIVIIIILCHYQYGGQTDENNDQLLKQNHLQLPNHHLKQKSNLSLAKTMLPDHHQNNKMITQSKGSLIKAAGS